MLATAVVAVVASVVLMVVDKAQVARGRCVLVPAALPGVTLDPRGITLAVLLFLVLLLVLVVWVLVLTL